MTGKELYEQQDISILPWGLMSREEQHVWDMAARVGCQEPAPAQRIGTLIGCFDPRDANAAPVVACKDCSAVFDRPWGGIFAHLMTHCPECSEKLAAQPVKPQRRAHIDRWRDLCPAIYQETELAQIPAHRRRPRQWTGFGGKGLLITGESRLQKTRVIWLIIRDMFESAKPPSSFRFFDSVDFGLEWADASGKYESKKFVEGVASADIVFFDDLGKAELSPTARGALFGIIEKRCAAKLPILATTNCTGETLAAGMDGNRGEPLVSRLREFCDCYKFTATATIGPV